MKIKIHGGTANASNTPLCYSCKHATVVQGTSARHEIIDCTLLDARITFPVTFCNKHIHRQHPTLWEMEDIAWVLRTDAKRGQIGFVRGKDLKAVERHVLREDW
jgi:hypothetical protein